MSRVTPWFSGSVKPARPGVYEIRCGVARLNWSHFSGTNWNGAWSSKKSAREESFWFLKNGDEGAASFLIRWRGLTSDPLKEPT